MMISLGRLRNINIFIAGEVRSGNYSVSSLTTVIQAIYLWRDLGKRVFRKIRLNRGGETFQNLDLYDLLLKGDLPGDRRLQSGDDLLFLWRGPLLVFEGK